MELFKQDTKMCNLKWEVLSILTALNFGNSYQAESEKQATDLDQVLAIYVSPIKH